jgi:hypothetical protein
MLGSYGKRTDYIDMVIATIEKNLGRGKSILNLTDEEGDKHIHNIMNDDKFKEQREYFKHIGSMIDVFHCQKNTIETLKSSPYYLKLWAFFAVMVFIEKKQTPLFTESQTSIKRSKLSAETANKQKKKDEKQALKEQAQVKGGVASPKVDDGTKKRKVDELAAKIVDLTEANDDEVAKVALDYLDDSDDDDEAEVLGVKEDTEGQIRVRLDGLHSALAEKVSDATLAEVRAFEGELKAYAMAGAKDEDLKIFQALLSRLSVNRVRRECDGNGDIDVDANDDDFEESATQYEEGVEARLEGSMGASEVKDLKQCYGRVLQEFMTMFYARPEMMAVVKEKLMTKLELPPETVLETVLKKGFDIRTLGKDSIPLGDSFKHIVEFIDVDLDNCVQPYLDYEDGDMSTFLNSLLWTLITMGAFGKEKLCWVVMNFMEQTLRWQAECPNVLKAISSNCMNLNGFYIELLNALIASYVKIHRKEHHLTADDLVQQSVMLRLCSQVKQLYRKSRGFAISGGSHSDMGRRRKACSGEKYAAKREKCVETIGYLMDAISDGHLSFVYQDRRSFVGEGLVHGKTNKVMSLEKVCERAFRLYSGQGRMGDLKLPDLKAELDRRGVPHPTEILEGHKKVLKPQFLQALRDFMFLESLEEIRKQRLASILAEQEVLGVQNVTRGMAARLARS